MIRWQKNKTTNRIDRQSVQNMTEMWMLMSRKRMRARERTEDDRRCIPYRGKGDWIISHTSISLNKTLNWIAVNDKMCVLQWWWWRWFFNYVLFFFLSALFNGATSQAFCSILVVRKRYDALGLRKHNRRMLQKSIWSWISRAIFWRWLNAHNDYDDKMIQSVDFKVVYVHSTSQRQRHQVKWNRPHFFFGPYSLFPIPWQFVISFLFSSRSETETDE